MPVSGGQLALVMAKVTTTNHCGQNTAIHTSVVPRTTIPQKLHESCGKTPAFSSSARLPSVVVTLAGVAVVKTTTDHCGHISDIITLH